MVKAPKPKKTTPPQKKIPWRRIGVGFGIAVALLIALLYWQVFSLPSRQGQLPSTDGDHQALQTRLHTHVKVLAADIGRRSPRDRRGIRQAADYIEGQFAASGYTVQRQTYDCGHGDVDNVWVELTGSEPDLPSVVIGAHYDSCYPQRTPGADDNASGVALLLELARALATSPQPRSLLFVAFTCEEPPYFQTKAMGSLRFARYLDKEKRAVAAMLSLESLGYFTDEPDSQSYPGLLSSFYPTTGNFVGVVGEWSYSRDLTIRVANLLKEHSKLPIESIAGPQSLPGIGWSDHWSFWKTETPAVMLTDTAPFRNPHYHRITDTVDTLNYPVMAQLADILPAVVRALAEK